MARFFTAIAFSLVCMVYSLQATPPENYDWIWGHLGEVYTRDSSMLEFTLRSIKTSIPNGKEIKTLLKQEIIELAAELPIVHDSDGIDLNKCSDSELALLLSRLFNLSYFE